MIYLYIFTFNRKWKSQTSWIYQYIQHNLAMKDELAGFGEVMSLLPKGSAKAKFISAFRNGEFVFTHTKYDFFAPKAGFDIFRFEERKIVEHCMFILIMIL